MTKLDAQNTVWSALREIGLGKILGWCGGAVTAALTVGVMVGARAVHDAGQVNERQDSTLAVHSDEIRRTAAGLDSLRASGIRELPDQVRELSLQVCLLRIEVRGESNADLCARLR